MYSVAWSDWVARLYIQGKNCQEKSGVGNHDGHSSSRDTDLRARAFALLPNRLFAFITSCLWLPSRQRGFLPSRRWPRAEEEPRSIALPCAAEATPVSAIAQRS